MDLPAYAQVALEKADQHAALRSSTSIVYEATGVALHGQDEPTGGWVTVVHIRQHWWDVPVNGLAAGTTHRVIERYLTFSEDGTGTIFAGCRTEPWGDQP